LSTEGSGTTLRVRLASVSFRPARTDRLRGFFVLAGTLTNEGAPMKKTPAKLLPVPLLWLLPHHANAAEATRTLHPLVLDRCLWAAVVLLLAAARVGKSIVAALLAGTAVPRQAYLVFGAFLVSGGMALYVALGGAAESALGA